MELKKEICNFGNTLINECNECLILDSFAVMYLNLKKEKKEFKGDSLLNERYLLLDNFFKKLNIIPKEIRGGLVFYKKNQKEEKQFFKKRNKSFGEKNLLNDLFFNFEKEISKIGGFIIINKN